jgi:hypothetical protein
LNDHLKYHEGLGDTSVEDSLALCKCFIQLASSIANKHRLVLLDTFVVPDDARKFLEGLHPIPSILITLHVLFLMRSQYLTFNTHNIGMFL